MSFPRTNLFSLTGVNTECGHLQFPLLNHQSEYPSLPWINQEKHIIMPWFFPYYTFTILGSFSRSLAKSHSNSEKPGSHQLPYIYSIFQLEYTFLAIFIMLRHTSMWNNFINWSIVMYSFLLLIDAVQFQSYLGQHHFFLHPWWGNFTYF